MKWFAAALAAALLMLQYRIWFSSDGVGEVMRLRAAVAEQQGDNERLSARNRQLAAEVRDLKQGYSALEERARSDLGMVASNETFFQVGPGGHAGHRAGRAACALAAALAATAGRGVQRASGPDRGRALSTRREPPRACGVAAATSYWLVMPAAGASRRFGARRRQAARRCWPVARCWRWRCSYFPTMRAAGASPWHCRPRRWPMPPCAADSPPRCRRSWAARGAVIRCWPALTLWAGARPQRTGCWCTMPRAPASAPRIWTGCSRPGPPIRSARCSPRP